MPQTRNAAGADATEAGARVVIVDLRTALDREVAPYRIPGARLIDPEELRHSHQLIPRDSEVVFYCAEPGEATSARTVARRPSASRMSTL